MNIEVSINDNLYTGFTNFSINRGFLDLAGRFQISIGLSEAELNVKQYPIRVGDRVEIYINGQQVVGGFVDGCRVSQSADNMSVSFFGRDATCDLIDSTISFAIAQGFTGSITLQQICEKIAENINLDSRVAIYRTPNVSNDDMFFQDGESLIASEGESAASFLQRAAQTKGLFINTDGLGSIVITRGGSATTEVSTTLVLSTSGGDNNNIVSSEMIIDYSKRFNDYRLFSQPILNRFSKDQIPDNTDLYNGVMDAGTVTDDEIRQSRKLTLDTALPLDKQQTIQRAIWEKSLRVSRSFLYKCEVEGFTYDGYNVWKPNLLVTVYDDYAQVFGEYLVDHVSFNLNDRDESTNLILVDKNSYLLQAELTKQASQAQRAGDAYKNRFSSND